MRTYTDRDLGDLLVILDAAPLPVTVRDLRNYADAPLTGAAVAGMLSRLGSAGLVHRSYGRGGYAAVYWPSAAGALAVRALARGEHFEALASTAARHFRRGPAS